MNITEELILEAAECNACQESIDWLREAPRTWSELAKHDPDWAAWALLRIEYLPINLEGLDSYNRAQVMASRPDCPINLEGLNSYERATVMVNRPDCPIDLEGLDSNHRARVMIGRLDCPINLEGLNPFQRKRVIDVRGVTCTVPELSLTS